jgi:endoglucanase
MKQPGIPLSIFIVCIFLHIDSFAQKDSSVFKIFLNQVGFYPLAEKKAIILTSDTGIFYLRKVNHKIVYTGKLTPTKERTFSGKQSSVANFSDFKTIGTFYVSIPVTGNSYQFSIKPAVHNSAALATVKAFYYQRTSLTLPERFAGKWYRAAGHPDNKILIHPSAASKLRPAGSIVSSPGGWYDAGDYNKYIVNSGISTSTLLSIYEDFPTYTSGVKLNIPEGTNKLPDILDEVAWNLRWMLTMQDPFDGGVYHKLTNADFDPMIMPEDAVKDRFMVQKGTSATLNFAAVTAQAARIFKNFNNQVPGLADSCLKASLFAYKWASENPNVSYEQNELNKTLSPKITTGAYSDKYFDDEFIWAASELYSTTGKADYLAKVISLDDPKFTLPTWSNVKLLGYYTLMQVNSTNPTIDTIKARVLKFANNLIVRADENPYQTVMGKSATNFNWGSNANAANQGILLLKAYKLTQNQIYLNYALANLDYILGRNGTGYSYLTGYGSKSPMHPHHRPSIADGIIDPIPGMMVGGPNPGMQDSIKLKSVAPDEAYIDNEDSYATNEIAINWNAPLAYLINGLEALQNKFGQKQK